jgi:hypothetical protein
MPYHALLKPEITTHVLGKSEITSQFLDRKTRKTEIFENVFFVQTLQPLQKISEIAFVMSFLLTYKI